jgi:hypothetical protein
MYSYKRHLPEAVPERIMKANELIFMVANDGFG